MRILAKTNDIIIAEYPPQTRTVKIKCPSASKDCGLKPPLNYLCNTAQVFSLPFPYLQFVYYAGSICVSARNHPAESYKDPAYHLPLSNLYANSGRVCQNKVYGFEEAISSFWFSKFEMSYDWLGTYVCRDIFNCGVINQMLEMWQSCTSDYMIEHIDWASESFPVDVKSFVNTVCFCGVRPGNHTELIFRRSPVVVLMDRADGPVPVCHCSTVNSLLNELSPLATDSL
jgi:hypothetical protein